MPMRLACSLVLAFFTLLQSVSAFGNETASFSSGKPIWLKGREKEMNVTVGFRAAFDAKPDEKATLRIAAATIYRAWLNGEFLGCGPARGPHGFYRVDAYDLSGKLKAGKNLVAIEVAGYNSNSYALLDQPSFLQAEVTSGSQVLASTGGKGQPFTAQQLTGRVQKVQRYSFQRPFSEVYRMGPSFDRWLRDASAPMTAAETAVQTEKTLLPRGVLYPDYAVDHPTNTVVAGRVESMATPKNLWKDRSLTNIGPKLKGFPEKELAAVPSIEAQCLRSTPTTTTATPYDAAKPIALAAKEYKIFDFGGDRTGFLGANVTCKQKTRLWFLFDELLTNNDVDFRRLGCVNIISFELEPGTYRLESIEPNTVHYLKLLCLDGACDVTDVHLREYAHPPVAAKFASSDPRLDRIFAAGVETFRQNSLDVFMDCPSRERAGWLCDSFFTSRAAVDLEGATRVEHNFVENFLLPAKFEHLPDGMLPMCYPSDHNDGVYIPNWALWFVVELDEYAGRSNDRATVDALRPKVLKLFDFFKKYENKDGLLEKLPSWVFVEWSEAAKFVQDVNYPSNMLYAGALAGAGRMYNMPELTAKANRILDAVRKQSFDGQFFVDNAKRQKDGSLKVTHNRTEVCQYYAFFFHAATPESHPALWATLRDKFGPNRKETKAFPEIFPANSFIGNMLRMELLSDAGLSRQILDESIAYLLYMADRTGTLWEHVNTQASCNHAFASHIVHTLYRDVLGVRSIDRVGRKVTIQFNDVPLQFCEGDIPTPDGMIHLRWQVKGRRIEYQLCLPPGYQATIVNKTGKRLVAR